MTFRRATAQALLMTGIIGLGTGNALSVDSGPEIKIEARLFNSATGQFSPNVLGPQSAPLGNVAASDEQSFSTFVVVHIVNDQLLPSETKVRLLAQEFPGSGQDSPKTILDQDIPVTAQAASKQDFYVGYWLPQTSCVPIRLVAELATGSDKDVATEASLNFTCHE